MAEHCSRCGQEVRWGWRAYPMQPVPTMGPSQGYWMHRDPVDDADHNVLFGQPRTPEQAAADEAAWDVLRTKLDANGNTVVYTTRTWKSKKAKTAEGAEGEEGKLEETWDGIMPEPEVRADASYIPYDATASHPVRSLVPNGVWLVLKPALEAGLILSRLTYARGPWLHAGGNRPKISETWVASIYDDRTSRLDPEAWAAVGCWRQTGKKWEFQHGTLVTGRTLEFCSAAEIKTWIKYIKEVRRGSST